MPKTKTRFVCQECGAYAIKWQGKCSECGNWNTLVEEIVTNIKESRKTEYRAPELLREIRVDPGLSLPTRIEEFDRVLGGGIVPGSIILIGGPPGIGKSTLLLQVSQSIAARAGDVLYISGEESSQQVKIRATRLNTLSEKIFILPEIGIESIITAIESLKPTLVLVDSVQTIFNSELSGAPGSVTQVRECTASLVRVGKALGITIIIAGHVTKEGQIAGPRVLEHLVDTVLYFEGEDRGSFRVLKSVKNRFGPTNEVGIFQMSSKGLASVENPSTFFISHRSKQTSGSIIVPVIEGTRPILVEIQALVSNTYANVPYRKAKGVDLNRLAVLIAVIDKRAGVKLASKDVYVKVAGGMEIEEPAIDLGLIISMASSVDDIPPVDGCAAFGEVGLGGEVRSVSQVGRRIQEAERLGFKKCIVPCYNLDIEDIEHESIEIVPVNNIKEAIDCALVK